MPDKKTVNVFENINTAKIDVAYTRIMDFAHDVQDDHGMSEMEIRVTFLKICQTLATDERTEFANESD